MKWLSLFDGCHCIGLGLRRAGHDVVATSEIEKHPAAVTRYHYPDMQELGDVTAIDTADVGPIDGIAGGWPCQGNSVAGLRGGLADERSGLFGEVVRLAGALAPRWLLLENVPGLLSVNGGRDMGAVVGALGELGYGVAWRVLDAQHFGVPQRRRRVFIVGCRGDVGRAAAVLFEPESVRGDSAPSGEAGAGVTGGTSTGSSSGGRIVNALRNRADFDHDGDQFALQVASVAVGVLGEKSHALTGEGFDASEDGTGRGNEPVVTHTLPDNGRHGSAVNAITSSTWQTDDNSAQGGHLIRCLTGHAGRFDGDTESFLVADMKPGDPAPTLAESSRLTAFHHTQDPITGSVSPCLSHQSTISIAPGVRRLMPIECERLQGLPDDWTRYGRKPDGTVYEVADGPRYKMIGNGAAVPVVEWIARRITGP